MKNVWVLLELGDLEIFPERMDFTLHRIKDIIGRTNPL